MTTLDFSQLEAESVMRFPVLRTAAHGSLLRYNHVANEKSIPNQRFPCNAAKSVSGIFHKSCSVIAGAFCGLVPLGIAGGAWGR